MGGKERHAVVLNFDIIDNEGAAEVTFHPNQPFEVGHAQELTKTAALQGLETLQSAFVTRIDNVIFRIDCVRYMAAGKWKRHVGTDASSIRCKFRW